MSHRVIPAVLFFGTVYGGVVVSLVQPPWVILASGVWAIWMMFSFIYIMGYIEGRRNGK